MAATRERKPTVTTAGSSSTITIGRAFTTIQEIVTFEKEIEKSKFISFLSQVKDPRATHNCWAYKISTGRVMTDDGEPSGTAGKPIHSSVAFSGLDKVMVVVIRAYGGVTSECLRNAPICLVKKARKQLKIFRFQYIEILIFDWNFRKVPMGVEVPFDLSRVLYRQDIKQDYDTGEDGIAMVSFEVDFDRLVKLEETIKANCSRELVFYKR
ncbi:hypothetical protein E1A91_A11G058400v1 [Gossypium mustelinum]|uniref:Impact N-terminal domain-containing protein n=2 Tax=Gossypium TaxID=3633 RepID=A0A5D2X2Z0_GOSMU|nr:hypothetical protein ES332_A11G060400v1 [Gossypium tomentosum]TYJ08206.1 hypothetical protein E1A91_A11G058400v1 [Gossypium mustelinum]